MDESSVNETTVTAAMIERLVSNHREFLGFLERRLGSRTDAEDILQAAFVRGVERVDSVRDGESVIAWFYRSLRNAVIDYHRRCGAAGRATEGFAREFAGAVEPPVEVVEAVCRCVVTLSDTLKPEYANALRRIEVDGLSVQEYAAEIGIEANNAAVRVYRARDALRKRVLTSCGTCAEHGCLNCTCESSCVASDEGGN